MRYTILLATLAVLFSGASIARPISYTGGWTVMQQVSTEASNTHIHYTPHHRTSIGVRLYNDEIGDGTYLQNNFLLKRHNTLNSQANAYLSFGLGEFNGHPSTFYGLSADWETRRYFTSYKFEQLNFHKGLRRKTHIARAGVAPYVGNYGDLHTWLMAQITKTEGAKTEHAFVLRFFQGAFLGELEISDQSSAALNFIYRF